MFLIADEGHEKKKLHLRPNYFNFNMREALDDIFAQAPDARQMPRFCRKHELRRHFQQLARAMHCRDAAAI